MASRLQQQQLSAPTPAVLVDAFSAVIVALDGQTLDLMHENMSKVGHMHCSTGPVLFGVSIGLISRAPAPELGFSPRPTLKLGKGGAEFVLEPPERAYKSFEALLAIDLEGLSCPQDPCGLNAFCQAWKGWGRPCSTHSLR